MVSWSPNTIWSGRLGLLKEGGDRPFKRVTCAAGLEVEGEGEG